MRRAVAYRAARAENETAMDKRLGLLRQLIGYLLFAFVVNACTSVDRAPERPSSNRQYEQAESLSREGKPLEAARLFEQVAQQSPGELRDRMLLRAAKEYLRADDADRATAVFKQVSTTLPSRDAAARALVSAELALRAQRPDRALADLNQIPQPLAARFTQRNSRPALPRVVCIESSSGRRHDGARSRTLVNFSSGTTRESTFDMGRVTT